MSERTEGPTNPQGENNLNPKLEGGAERTLRITHENYVVPTGGMNTRNLIYYEPLPNLIVTPEKLDSLLAEIEASKPKRGQRKKGRYGQNS